MKTWNKMAAVGLLSHFQQGVSLVEIMVALVLSLILVGGVGQIYLGSKQTYRVQDGQSRLQENARYALETLNHDLRLSGYLGCQSSNSSIPVIVIANAPLVAPNTATAFPANVVAAAAVSGGTGDQNTTQWVNPSPALSSAQKNNVVGSSDAITVQFAESCGGVTTADMSTAVIANAQLAATNTCGGTGAALVIADCQKVNIFRAAANSVDTSQNSSGGNATSSLYVRDLSGKIIPILAPNRGFRAGSEIFRFRSYTYYIRFNSSSNEPSLFRFDNTSAAGTNNPVELVEGIESMQIRYGVNTLGTTPSSANQYLSANMVTDWAQVVSVQITLTARSVGENADNLTATPNSPRAYDKNLYYGDASKGFPPDRHLVRKFSATISLRNRLQ